MKMYTKPIISIDTELAEGVYAASGSDNTVTLVHLLKLLIGAMKKGSSNLPHFFQIKLIYLN